MADKKEPAYSSRQATLLVPRKHAFEESEKILGVCGMVEEVVWGGIPRSEPIVGKRDGVSCGYGEFAAQCGMMGLVFPDESLRFQYDRGAVKMVCLTISTHPRV